MKLASIIAIFASLLFIVPSGAQTTQRGVVQEYNEKAKKTPLAGVELNVRNANNAVSAKDGSFTLQFQTLKPGDKITVRRIEKLGYEIFNKEALEQWNLNPNSPFVIVLCRSEKLKKLHDIYFSNVSASYKRQFEKETQNLNRLKEQNRLKEAEYYKKLREIEDQYESQLDKLENYVDRLARIDLSELSSAEHEIIELIQSGNMEDAIKRYEAQNIVEKQIEALRTRDLKKDALAKVQDAVKRDDEAIDSLYKMNNRYIQTLMIAGGISNYYKVKDIYIKIAEADGSNIDWLNQTGVFLSTYYADYDNAQMYYEKALKISLASDTHNDYEIVRSYFNIASIYRMKRDYQNSILMFHQAIDKCKALRGEVNTDIGHLYESLATTLNEMGDIQEALKYYFKALEMYDSYLPPDHPWIAYIYRNIGNTYIRSKNYKSALEYCSRALDFYDKDIIKNKYQISLLYNDVGVCHLGLGRYPEALEYSLKANEIQKKELSQWHPELATSYYNIAHVCDVMQDYKNSEIYYTKAVEIRERILDDSDPVLLDSYEKAADSCVKNKKYKEALSLYSKIIGIKEKRPNQDYADLATQHYRLGLYHLFLKNIDNTIQEIKCAIEYAPKEYLYYDTLSQIYLDRGYRNEAVATMRRILDHAPDFDLSIMQVYKMLYPDE